MFIQISPPALVHIIVAEFYPDKWVRNPVDRDVP